MAFKMRNILIAIFILLNLIVKAQSDLTSNCIMKPDTIDGLEVLTVAEKMPVFKVQESLNAYLYEHIKFREVDKEDLQFKFYTTFIIDTLGRVRNACIMKPLYPDRLTEMEKEVLTVIQLMPAWTSAENKGKKVPIRFNLPINIEYK